MAYTNHLIPVYTTRGDVRAFLVYPYLYSVSGEWIGWLKPDRSVYSVHGQYVGWITSEPRILRKMADSFDRRREIPPRLPPKPNLPASCPLAPLMAELTYGVIDVLEDRPELLPCVDFGDLRPDID